MDIYATFAIDYFIHSKLGNFTVTALKKASQK